MCKEIRIDEPIEFEYKERKVLIKNQKDYNLLKNLSKLIIDNYIKENPEESHIQNIL